MGEISTHVISKLGLPSVAGSPVRVFYSEDPSASVVDAGAKWNCETETALSGNGGHDSLVKEGDLKKGLYLVEYDFSGVDAAARWGWWGFSFGGRRDVGRVGGFGRNCSRSSWMV